MNNFVRSFLTEWRKLGLPFEDKTFVAAVSGGADSVALLLALEELRKRKKLRNRLVVAHINHNLRGEESEKDAEFVKDLACRFDLEFVCKTADRKSKKGNIEQDARDGRYNFLRETAENLDAYGVLTAHTLNDQAETLLLNLIRGSGLEGLSGMKTVRSLESEILLIRPLLSWAKRGDTTNFCRVQDVKFRSDSMNDDEAFSRVRIRKTVMPMLAELNPKIVETLAKMASILREDLVELNRNAGETKHGALTLNGANELQLKGIKDLLPSARLRLLREWLRINRGDLRKLSAKHLDSIDNLIFSRKSGKTIELPDLDSVEKRNGKLIFVKNPASTGKI